MRFELLKIWIYIIKYLNLSTLLQIILLKLHQNWSSTKGIHANGWFYIIFQMQWFQHSTDQLCIITLYISVDLGLCCSIQYSKSQSCNNDPILTLIASYLSSNGYINFTTFNWFLAISVIYDPFIVVKFLLTLLTTGVERSEWDSNPVTT